METDKIIFTPSANGMNESLFTINNTFTQHGNEIEEIISNKPPYIVRWGTVFFFVLLLALSLVSWYIKYPDIVIATAKLNSVNGPQQVITRTDGKLIKIAVKDNEKVDSGEILGYMESIADPKSVNEISDQIDSISDLINQNRIDEIILFFPSYNTQKSLNNLGELQTPYQTFIQSFIAFRDFFNSDFFLHKKAMLLPDIQNIQKSRSVADNQKKIYQQDGSLSKETFNANKTLVKEKIIPAAEHRNEKRKEIAELENQILVRKITFLQALQTIKSQVQAYKYKHVLEAPVSGTVSFTSFFQENQEMKTGQLLFFVQPGNTSYFVEMLIPQYNSGKVKQGQKVLLKFQAYPYEQYGSVIGKIDNIKSILTDSGYLAKVILPQGLVTNYNKTLPYRDGLIAQADIITQDMRLLERFYSKVRKEFER